MTYRLTKIQCSHIEALKKKERLIERKKALQDELLEINNQLRMLSRVINSNDEFKQKWIIDVPLIVFTNRSSGAKRMNWKKIIMELFVRYDVPMTSALIYNKIVANYENVPFDKRFALKNISAALSYLVAKDKKLVKVKSAGKPNNLYGLQYFFDKSQKMKPAYEEKYKLENGEV